jgi:hypothetical protein
MRMPRPGLALLALCALPMLTTVAQGQDRSRGRTIRISYDRRDRVPDREISMSVGAFNSRDDDKNLPMASLRTDWRLRRWLRSEAGIAYAIGSIDVPGSGSSAATSRTLQFGTATLGLRAELPTDFIRPYVGIAAGLTRRDEEGGDPYIRTTMAFPAGLRLLLSNRVSLRAEVRARFDQRRTGGEAPGIEQTGGLSVVF